MLIVTHVTISIEPAYIKSSRRGVIYAYSNFSTSEITCIKSHITFLMRAALYQRDSDVRQKCHLCVRCAITSDYHNRHIRLVVHV